jgi:DNA polymerase III epsilon subunit-like protein
MKLCFIDLETSGLEPPDAVILSIGAISGKDELYIVVKPTDEEWQRASPKALEVNGMTWDEVSGGVSLNDAKWMLMQFLLDHDIVGKKGRFVGQNPTFDMKFLNFYMGSELDFIGAPTNNPFDIRELYRFLVQHDLAPVLDYYSGKRIANSLGVEEEPEPHNALEGAKVVRRNYYACKKLWKSK